MHILVVAATAAEAAHVPASLPLVVTGPGKTAAAVATARALAARPTLDGLTVVNIGTAGSLRDDIAGLHEPGVVLNHVSDSADESAVDWPAMVEASAVVLGKWLRENC